MSDFGSFFSSPYLRRTGDVESLSHEERYYMTLTILTDMLPEAPVNWKLAISKLETM